MQKKFNQALLTTNLNFATRDMLYYSSVAVSALDAVLSIRADYCKTIKIRLEKFCKLYNITWKTYKVIPSKKRQITVSEVYRRMNGITADILAKSLKFEQPATTTKNNNKRIKKTEAFLRFIKILIRYGIDTYQDIINVIKKGGFCELEQELKEIPGQKVSVDYFFMLASKSDTVKVDRHIRKFALDVTGEKYLKNKQIVDLFRNGAAFLMQNGYPEMTPRYLDHIVWEYQKKNKKE